MREQFASVSCSLPCAQIVRQLLPQDGARRLARDVQSWQYPGAYFVVAMEWSPTFQRLNMTQVPCVDEPHRLAEALIDWAPG